MSVTLCHQHLAMLVKDFTKNEMLVKKELLFYLRSFFVLFLTLRVHPMSGCIQHFQQHIIYALPLVLLVCLNMVICH